MADDIVEHVCCEQEMVKIRFESRPVVRDGKRRTQDAETYRCLSCGAEETFDVGSGLSAGRREG